MSSSEANPAPELLSKGQYSLYKSPDGGMHLAYRAEGMTEDGHLVAPPAMVRMAIAAAEGKGPFARLRALFPFGGPPGIPDGDGG